MQTAPAMPMPAGAPRRSRSLSIAVGVVLCIEAFFAPAVWLITLLFAAFTYGDESWWADGLDRIGPWGAIMVFVPLVGAALVIFLRPVRLAAVSAIVCFLAAIINAALAVGLLLLNAQSDGPIGPRLEGVAIALGFGFVAGRLVVECADLVRRPRAAKLPPSP